MAFTNIVLLEFLFRRQIRYLVREVCFCLFDINIPSNRGRFFPFRRTVARFWYSYKLCFLQRICMFCLLRLGCIWPSTESPRDLRNRPWRLGIWELCWSDNLRMDDTFVWIRVKVLPMFRCLSRESLNKRKNKNHFNQFVRRTKPHTSFLYLFMIT